MRIDTTTDNRFMILSSPYPHEMNVMRIALTREINNAWMLKKTNPTMSVERCFMNDYNLVPIGLWLEVIKIAKKANIALDLSDNLKLYINQFQMEKEPFVEYVKETFKDAKIPIIDKKTNQIIGYNPFMPYDYQIDAAYAMLKYRNCCGEISTSGGKTLISFIIFKYLIDVVNVNKILYIVPSVDLATQSAEKYELYESYLNVHHHNWTIGILKANLKKAEKERVENCNILFGTFQSLCKKTQDFFKFFNACICDECVDKNALITMADGSKKKIADVVEGDKVYTINDISGEYEINEVEYVYKNEPKEEVYELELEDGKKLRLTANHKVKTINRGFVRVDDLNCDDEIVIL